MGLFKGSWDWRPARLLEGLGIDNNTSEVLSGDIASGGTIDQVDRAVDPILFGEQKKLDAEAAAAAKRSIEQRDTMSGYWENYQTWAADAKTAYNRNTGSAKARMASVGIQSGSDQWNERLARVEGEYETELAGLKKGVTGAAMSQWVSDSQVGSDKPMGMEDYLSQEFGMKSFASDRSTTDVMKAEAKSRQAAAGTRDKSKATATASPWW